MQSKCVKVLICYVPVNIKPHYPPPRCTWGNSEEFDLKDLMLKIVLPVGNLTIQNFLLLDQLYRLSTSCKNNMFPKVHWTRHCMGENLMLVMSPWVGEIEL